MDIYFDKILNKLNLELMNIRGFDSGFLRNIDIVIFDVKKIKYKTSLEYAKTIFIKIELVNYFMENIFHLINHKYTIIIGGGDITFPKNIDKRYFKTHTDISISNLNKLTNSKFINNIFVENLMCSLPKTYPIPLGINPFECSTNLNYFLKFINIDKNKPLKFTNFNRVRDGKGQWEERSYVKNLCRKYWNKYFIETDITSHKNYLTKMSSYLFTICVHGGGLDVNPKLWEALIVGVIPIIKENKPYTDIYVNLDFPVVIVKNWNSDTINENNLLSWYNKYYIYFTDNIKRKQLIMKLSLNFWLKYILMK